MLYVIPDTLLKVAINTNKTGHHVMVQHYFSYIVAVNFIGGGNRRAQRKPPTCRKSLTNIIT